MYVSSDTASMDPQQSCFCSYWVPCPPAAVDLYCLQATMLLLRLTPLASVQLTQSVVVKTKTAVSTAGPMSAGMCVQLYPRSAAAKGSVATITSVRCAGTLCGLLKSYSDATSSCLEVHKQSVHLQSVMIVGTTRLVVAAMRSCLQH